jgi:diguanylate cyclase (GGDEF)-like protein
VHLKDDPDNAEKKIFDVINFDILDGLIIFPDYIRHDEVLNALVSKSQKRGIPVLSVDGYRDDCYNLTYDFTTALEAMIRHIVEIHGCRHVNFFSAEKGNPYAEERLDCYRKVLGENGIAVEEKNIYYGNFEGKMTYELVDRMIAEDNLPQAVICANDEMAIAACDALYMKGIRTPDDVLITGFDGIPTEKYHTPRISTCEIDWDEIGSKVIGLFTDIFDGKTPAKHTVIGHTAVFRLSCGCNPSTVADTNASALEGNRFRKGAYEFNVQLFGLTNLLSDSQSYEDFFNTLARQMDMIECSYFRLCLVDGFIIKELTEKMIFRSSKGNFSKTSQIMRAVFSWGNGIRRDTEELFLKTEMLPHIREVIDSEDERNICFFPVCHHNEYVGYVTMELDMERVNLNHVFAYMLNFSNSVEVMKSINDTNLAVDLLKHMYVHDQMTDLYNRRGFYTELDAILGAPQNETACLVAFSIDMDGMKFINDNHGHHEGDNAIKAVAAAMTNAGRDCGVISARFGGDEFIAAAITESPHETANTFIAGIAEYLRNYNTEKEYKVQTSIGYACEQIDRINKDIDGLIRLADASMYSDKKDKKTRRKSERVPPEPEEPENPI